MQPLHHHYHTNKRKKKRHDACAEARISVVNLVYFIEPFSHLRSYGFPLFTYLFFCLSQFSLLQASLDRLSCLFFTIWLSKWRKTALSCMSKADNAFAVNSSENLAADIVSRVLAAARISSPLCTLWPTKFLWSLKHNKSVSVPHTRHRFSSSSISHADFCQQWPHKRCSHVLTLNGVRLVFSHPSHVSSRLSNISWSSGTFVNWNCMTMMSLVWMGELI